MSASTESAAGQPIRRFATDCDAAFRGMLARYGFRPAAKDTSAYLASRVYRSGERYIQVTATTHVLDGQSHCQVYVGEGSHDWPDTDWNKVALWQLAVARGGAQPKGGVTTGFAPSAVPLVPLRRMQHRSNTDGVDLCLEFYPVSSVSIRGFKVLN